VYFPFGLSGRGYRVGSAQQVSWLRRQERLRHIGYVLMLIVGVLTQPALDGASMRVLLFAGILLGYQVVTGWYLRWRAQGLEPLARQPNMIERAAEASEVSVRGAYVMTLGWAALVAAMGVGAWVGGGAYALGLVLLGLCLWATAQATIAYRRAVGRRPSGGEPTAPN
jgi:hypothetical protein